MGKNRQYALLYFYHSCRLFSSFRRKPESRRIRFLLEEREPTRPSLFPFPLTPGQALALSLRERVPGRSPAHRIASAGRQLPYPIPEDPKARRPVLGDVHAGGDCPGPIAFRGSRDGIALEFRRAAGMDRAGQHFPRAADAVLLVTVQDRILGVRIGALHRGTIAQQPRFAFLDGDSEQRSRARCARRQHGEQFSFERDAIPLV